jgi:hypothetical protein
MTARGRDGGRDTFSYQHNCSSHIATTNSTSHHINERRAEMYHLLFSSLTGYTLTFPIAYGTPCIIKILPCNVISVRLLSSSCVCTYGILFCTF